MILFKLGAVSIFNVKIKVLLTKSLEIVLWPMKCAHLKYHVNTMSTSREILFFTPLAYKPNLENLTFIFLYRFFTLRTYALGASSFWLDFLCSVQQWCTLWKIRNTAIWRRTLVPLLKSMKEEAISLLTAWPMWKWHMPCTGHVYLYFLTKNKCHCFFLWNDSYD